MPPGDGVKTKLVTDTNINTATGRNTQEFKLSLSGDLYPSDDDLKLNLYVRGVCGVDLEDADRYQCLPTIAVFNLAKGGFNLKAGLLSETYPAAQKFAGASLAWNIIPQFGIEVHGGYLIGHSWANGFRGLAPLDAGIVGGAIQFVTDHIDATFSADTVIISSDEDPVTDINAGVSFDPAWDRMKIIADALLTLVGDQVDSYDLSFYATIRALGNLVFALGVSHQDAPFAYNLRRTDGREMPKYQSTTGDLSVTWRAADDIRLMGTFGVGDDLYEVAVALQTEYIKANLLAFSSGDKAGFTATASGYIQLVGNIVLEPYGVISYMEESFIDGGDGVSGEIGISGTFPIAEWLVASLALEAVKGATLPWGVQGLLNLTLGLGVSSSAQVPNSQRVVRRPSMGIAVSQVVNIVKRRYEEFLAGIFGGFLENMDSHGDLVESDRKKASCTSCHSSEVFFQAEQKVLNDEDEGCAGCHDAADVEKKMGEGAAGFNHKGGQAVFDCGYCHTSGHDGRRTIVKEPDSHFVTYMVGDITVFRGHNQKKEHCGSTCHDGATVYNGALLPSFENGLCVDCHDENPHGRTWDTAHTTSFVADSKSCFSAACHSKPEPLNKLTTEASCTKCHGQSKMRRATKHSPGWMRYDRNGNMQHGKIVERLGGSTCFTAGCHNDNRSKQPKRGSGERICKACH
jgi:hypothetical protein